MTGRRFIASVARGGRHTVVVTDFDAQAGRHLPPRSDLSMAEAQGEDDDVSGALRGLAGLISDVDDLDAVLTQIAEFAVAAIPGADGAGVTLVRNTGDSPAVLAWAVTAPFVEQIDHLQYDICHEGPCLTAMQTRRSLISGSLGSDQRWPRFGGRVARLRVHSALSLPLVRRGDVVGALNIYAHERDVFTEHALRLGEQYARPAAVTVGNLQLLQAAYDRATQLQMALTSRAVIDQAIGIVRSRSGGTEREAFDRLREISQAEKTKLAVVAQRLVDEAVRRVHGRQTEST